MLAAHRLLPCPTYPFLDMVQDIGISVPIRVLCAISGWVASHIPGAGLGMEEIAAAYHDGGDRAAANEFVGLLEALPLGANLGRGAYTPDALLKQLTATFKKVTLILTLTRMKKTNPNPNPGLRASFNKQTKPNPNP